MKEYSSQAGNYRTLQCVDDDFLTTARAYPRMKRCRMQEPYLIHEQEPQMRVRRFRSPNLSASVAGPVKVDEHHKHDGGVALGDTERFVDDPGYSATTRAVQVSFALPPNPPPEPLLLPHACDQHPLLGSHLHGRSPVSVLAEPRPPLPRPRLGGAPMRRVSARPADIVSVAMS